MNKNNSSSDSSGSATAADDAHTRAIAAGGGVRRPSSRRPSSLTIDSIPAGLVLSIRGIKIDDNLHHIADEQHDIEASVVVPVGDNQNQQGNEHERTSGRRRKSTLDSTPTAEINGMISTWANALGYSNNDNDHNDETHKPSGAYSDVYFTIVKK